MADWHRMEWQYRANVWAEIVRCVLVVLAADEVVTLIEYHFPGWMDIVSLVSLFVYWIAWWVDRHTRMYRFDLD